MDSEDFEFEEFVIAKAAGLAFHGFDFVVGPFHRAGDEGVVDDASATGPADEIRPVSFAHAWATRHPAFDPEPNSPVQSQEALSSFLLLASYFFPW
jgi:hypothetical protein